MEQTQEYIDFKGTITVDVFASLFKNAPQVQNAFDKFDSKIALIQSGSLSFYADESDAKKETVKDIEQAERSKNAIITFEQDLKQATDDIFRRELMGQITAQHNKLQRIESRLARRDSSDLLFGKTEFQTNHMHANGLLKLAEDLGQWFATGAAGPGTVTFRGKSYTAQ